MKCPRCGETFFINFCPKCGYNITNVEIIEDGDYVILKKDSINTLIKYNGNEKHIIIPPNISVVDEGCFSDNDNIKIIEVCNDEKILKRRSINLPSLEYIRIGKNVEIMENAIWNAHNLKGIHYDGSLNDWCNVIFNSDRAIKILFKNTNTANKFDPNNYMTIKNIDFNEFDNMPKSLSGFFDLESVILPDDCTKISESFFIFLRKLKTIRIPDGCKVIGGKAFFCCESLETIVIPNSVEVIGALAFSNCNRLKNVVLPDKLKRIEKSTFAYCKSLEEIKIPKDIEYISVHAFTDSYDLEDGDCSLKRVIYKGTESKWKRIKYKSEIIKRAVVLFENEE